MLESRPGQLSALKILRTLDCMVTIHNVPAVDVAGIGVTWKTGSLGWNL